MNDKKIKNPVHWDGIDRLEALVMKQRLDRRQFVVMASALGLTGTAAVAMAQQAVAISGNQSKRQSELQASYDFIVVGAGSSGAVVASRLSENPDISVLLVEAGGTDDAASILNPALWYTNIGGEFDWGFRTTPQKGLNGRSILQPMGKALGGGSSINAMIWARGHRDDYEYWAEQAGDKAWGYQSVLDIYRRIEDWQGPADPARRGRGGIVYVQPAPDPSPLAAAMLAGAQSIGIPVFDDQNGAMMEGDGGIAIANVTIKDGRRRNVPSHYLHQAMARPNLTVLTKAFVRRLHLQEKSVSAVEFEWNGQIHKILANQEVVLSAGAVNTPKILMLSGIGNARELAALGIRPVENLPGVGQNFQDHLMVASCMWEPPATIAPRNNAAEATFFWKSKASLKTPDLQPFQIEVPYTSDELKSRAVANGWTIAPGIVRPKSRGHLRLLSRDPNARPAIHSNSLAHPDDVAALRVGIELCREIGNSAAMRPFVKREVMPGPVKGTALDNFIRNGAVSYYHETCTARMGRDAMSVVDARLQVYGIKKLRIADGSIMPRVTTGNTMAPCVIIGERAAVMIRGS